MTLPHCAAPTRALVLWLLGAAFGTAAPLFEQTDVFVSGRDGYVAYRIPAIETAPDGSLLAFAEARKFNLHDPGYERQDIDLVMKRSQDGGRTWTEMKILEDPGEFWSAANPATVVDRKFEPWGVFAVMSDDHGRTWRRGELVPGASGDESQLVELSDGRLLFDIRQQRGPHRLRALSADGGKTWSRTNAGEKVSAVACALERFASGEAAGDGRNRLLWTGPKGPQRSNLVVRVSYDEGATFPRERLLGAGPAAYSDLTVLRDHTVGILWERGINANYQFISFTRLNREWLEEQSDPDRANVPGPRVVARLNRIVQSGGESRAVTERELIPDNHFQRGFILWQPQPGKHVRYGELPGFEENASPEWGLSQWSSKFPLEAPTGRLAPANGILSASNAAKFVAMGRPGGGGGSGADLVLAANSGVEYGAKARRSGEPWVHLLVEQEFPAPALLAGLREARFRLEARLVHSRNLHRDDYSPGLHAAQFQVFFTVQNRNRSSPGYGDLLWFGIPVYDNRHRHPPEHKSKDFGGTEKFIFTPEGKTFTAGSTHDREWLIVEKDLLPLMREALEMAWARGFLSGSKELADYAIGGMNMGWELPGTFDVQLEVRNLSLKVAEGVTSR